MALEALTSGNQSVSPGQAQSLQAGQRAKDTAAAAKAKVTGAMTAGWVILGLGITGYALSETHIFGPMLAVLLALATIYQLNQYTQRKKA